MIDKRFSVVDSQIVKPVFALLLFCGLALVLSIPSGETVKDFAGLAALQRGGFYFYVYIFFSGVLGLSLGTVAANGWCRFNQSAMEALSTNRCDPSRPQVGLISTTRSSQRSML